MAQPESIFIWRHFTKQSSFIIDWFKGLVPSESWDEVIRNPEQYFYEEDESQDCSYSTKAKLAQKFKETYYKIRLFHACRPTDVRSYLLNGLVPLDIEAASKLARDLFLSAEYPSVTETMLMDTVASLRVENRGGHLYLSLDDLNLIKYANHYLLYGSEYIHIIAKRLSEQTGADCLSALMKIGIPTIFACDIPTSDIPDLSIQHLVEKLIRCALLYLEDNSSEIGSIDFTFTFHSPLPAKFIISHYHPGRIFNTINPVTSCPFCERS